MALAVTPLAGKVAVMLGGTGGIGSAAARLFAEAGARVAVVASRDVGKATALATALPGSGHRGYAAAIERSDELTALAGDVAAQLGGADILVNSAAVTCAVPHAELDTMDDERFDHILRVNTRGAFAAVRAFAPLLRAKNDGLVVNISSLSGSSGNGSSIAYCASKAALDVMGKSLARALAPAIRVLTVSPGIVDTDFVPGRDKAARDKQAPTIPLRRIATPQDCAEAVLACATSLRFSTGSIIQIDGGRHL
ncbi:MAG TPA: SDR family oxidoreductase [Acetobacteraceae bacterium]|nr:SDR family oxidoreductase [Acetobacteraceae bacterium]